MSYQFNTRPTYYPTSGGGYTPQPQPTPVRPNGGTGPILGPSDSSGTPNPIGPTYTPPRQTNPTQAPLPTPGRLPPSLQPQFQGMQILRDSNPVRYPQPIGTTSASSTTGQWNPFPPMSAGAQAAQSVGGAVLGSSTSQPSFYGGGLSPASGLGGGLYPSLVGLYR